MKLFSESVKHTFTNSSHNILQVESFNEIFFDIFEIEINKSKYPVEKISEYDRNPVVSVPVLIEGVEVFFPFVLTKGKFGVFFNESNTLESLFPDGDFDTIKQKPEIIEEQIDDSVIVESIEEVEYQVNQLVDKKSKILQQIKLAKKDARKNLDLYKKKVISEATDDIKKSNKILQETLDTARESLVSEFLTISENIKTELFELANSQYPELQETINNKISILSEDLTESFKSDFENSTTIFDKKLQDLVKELYKISIEPKINTEVSKLTEGITNKVIDIENDLYSKLDNKVDKELVEEISNEIDAIRISNIELNDNITKGVNKALSRVGNVKNLVGELSLELDNKINEATVNITNYYAERLTLLENKQFDLSEESTKYFIDLITESRNNLLGEIAKIKTEKPVEYIIESAKGPEKIDVSTLKKEYDKIISDKFANTIVDLKKYIVLHSGGGTVAVQFADGGTMNGDLVVTGNTTTNTLTVNNGVTVLGGLSADRIYTTQLDALSANITVIDIKQYELSGFNVQGDCTVQGSVSADKFVTIGGLSSQFVKGDGSLDDNIYLTSESLNSNIILYPTTTPSDVVGYGLMVSSITDVAYDDPAVDVPTGPIDSANTYISSIISREGLIIGDLDTINMTVIGKIRKTNGGTNKNATFHFHVYKRNNVGNETPIGVSGDTLTVTSSLYEEYSASVLLPASTWLPTDKLVLKLYGILIGSGSGSSPTYDFQFGGDTPVRVLIPLPTSVQLSNYVPYIGASKDLDLGVHTVNTAAVYTNSINVNTLSATTLSADRIYTTQLDALSANITVIDIKQYELSGFNVQGDCTIQGNVSASGNLSASDIYSNGNRVATVVDPVRTSLTGNGILSTFNLSGASGIVNPSALIVAIDGAMQEPVVDYTVLNSQITFTSPLANGSKAVVISPTNTLQVSQMIPADGSVTSTKLDTDIEIVGQLTAPNQTASTSDSIMTLAMVEELYGWELLLGQAYQTYLSGSGVNAAGINSSSFNTGDAAGNNVAGFKIADNFNRSPMGHTVTDFQSVPYQTGKTRIKFQANLVTLVGDAQLWCWNGGQSTTPVEFPTALGFGMVMTATTIRSVVHNNTTHILGNAYTYGTLPHPSVQIEVEYYQGVCITKLNGVAVSTVSGGFTSYNPQTTQNFYGRTSTGGVTNKARVELKNIKYRITQS